jgi:hypothetical protein
MGMPRAPVRARRRAKTHNHWPVGPPSDLRRVAGELQVGISHGSAGWIRIHWMALAGFIGPSGGILRRGACPRSVLAGDRAGFAEGGGRCGVADGAPGRAEKPPSVGPQQRDSAGSIHTSVTEGLAQQTPASRLRPVDRKCAIPVPHGRSRNPSVRRGIVPSRPVANSGSVLR